MPNSLREMPHDNATGWSPTDGDGEAIAYAALGNLMPEYTYIKPAQQVAQGLPKGVVERLQIALGISQKEVADALMIPQRTLNRWERIPAAEADRVLRFGMLFQRALQVLGDGLNARRWLNSPKHAFGDRTPLFVARTELGASQVHDLLGQIEHGVFA